MRNLYSPLIFQSLIESIINQLFSFFYFSKKRLELSTHKGYDENLANGFVTINIKHQPEIEAKLNPQERKEQFIANGPILTDICTKLKEDERKQDQLKYINVINEHHELPPRK